MPAGRICITSGCGKRAERGARCVGCAIEYEARRGSRHQRGYGTAHDRVRARLVAAWAAAIRRGATWTCPRCGRPLVPGQRVDADHFTETLRNNPHAEADALSHERCNRGARPGTPGP